MIIRLRGKLIEQSEAGKCLVIGTIMADCLIINQQKISEKFQVSVEFGLHMLTPCKTKKLAGETAENSV